MSYEFQTITVEGLGQSVEQLRELAIDRAKVLCHFGPGTFTAQLIHGTPGSWGPVRFKVCRCRRKAQRLVHA